MKILFFIALLFNRFCPVVSSQTGSPFAFVYSNSIFCAWSGFFNSLSKRLVNLLSKELPPKKAAKITAEYLNGISKDIYNYIIKK